MADADSSCSEDHTIVAHFAHASVAELKQEIVSVVADIGSSCEGIDPAIHNSNIACQDLLKYLELLAKALANVQTVEQEINCH